MCEKCRLMELFDEELARFESGEAFSFGTVDLFRPTAARPRHGDCTKAKMPKSFMSGSAPR